MGVESKTGRYERDTLLIGGPKAIIDAFFEFRQKEGHTSHWRALQQLLRQAGLHGSLEQEVEMLRERISSLEGRIQRLERS